MRLVRRPRRITAALGLLAASTLLGSTAAQAQDAPSPSLGGYRGSAHASGLHAYYLPEGLLPTGALLDFGAPDALATVSSGPVTFARAGIADPGDLLANPDALLSQLSPGYPAGTIPKWPFRITANSSIGEPRATSAPAPGLEAAVEATPEGSTAQARTPSVDVEGLASLGSMSSESTTTFDGSTVTVHARSELAHFDLLGVISIESVVSEVTATSDGGETQIEGGTVVAGAKLLGFPLVIDDEGIRFADGAPMGLGLGDLLNQLTGDLTDMLEQAGIRITLAGPLEPQDGSTGQLGSTGLRIDLSLSASTVPFLDQLFELIPPLPALVPGLPTVEDLIAATQANHLVTVDIARAEASLVARPAAEIPPFEPPERTTDTVASVVATPPPPQFAAPSMPAPAPSAPVSSPVETTQPLAAESPALTVGSGIGALALLALLLQPFLGDRLARASAAVLGTEHADLCPREVQR